MINIVFVYKTGGIYTKDDVRLIVENLKDHITVEHRTVCLSDDPFGVLPFVDTALPLTENWPGWWSKIELFKPGQFKEPCLFFDLDTRFLNNLDDIASYRGDFCALRDFNRLQNLASGVLAWRPSQKLDYLFENFRVNYDYIVDRHRRNLSGKGIGDQGYIQSALPLEPDFFQDLFPSKIISYKKHFTQEDCSRDNASVLCFHGKPKPTEVIL